MTSRYLRIQSFHFFTCFIQIWIFARKFSEMLPTCSLRNEFIDPFLLGTVINEVNSSSIIAFLESNFLLSIFKFIKKGMYVCLGLLLLIKPKHFISFISSCSIDF